VFLENMLSVSQPIGGTFSTFWGENRVGYVALHDLAAVTAKVLRDGPERHGSKDYYLSTETMTGSELAAALSEVLDRSIRCEVLGPSDMEAHFKKGTVEVEDWYARSSLELLTQFADGRMGYMGTVKDDVPYLLGRPAIGVRAWAEMHKAQLLAFVDNPSGR
jgi:hypothetical protein